VQYSNILTVLELDNRSKNSRRIR